ncbi:phospholipase A2 group XV [Daphnia magna]|uniref:Group XV phospholipase A2 n=2 Tax=Daphnia magna TaxID=35525 RepID=A0A0P6FXQ6_9CRUS|nr:phospholipase A2 group XV [Daphnia magna]KAK4015285.1 hypothetical protein OUZ56_030267 [Daphnia magna]KZS09165.1 Group XV phospholipase A2 [Daphnia magna]
MRALRCFQICCITLLFSQICISANDLQGHPVILVPGDGGSQIEGRLDKPTAVHYVCSKKTDYWFSLWLNMELLVPIVIDCWVDNMKLTYDNITRTTSNNLGVDIRIPDFGNSTSVEWIDPSKASAGNYFATIAESILKFGYERNVSLRGAPYDFRKAPNELQDYFVNTKALVEDTYSRTNGQKIIFITHSMGSPMILYFLNHQTQEWKNKYIKSWISLAGCWAGTIKALKVYAQGDNLGVRVLSETALREQQRTSPSLSWLMPSSMQWSPEEVMVQTSSRNYTIQDYQEFFLDIDFPLGYDMWQDTHPLVHELTAPGVEIHCIFGTGVDTAERLVYTKSTPLGKATIIMGDGDGTVNVRSLAACSKWVNEQSQPVYVQAFPKRDHMAVLYDPVILDYIQRVVAASQEGEAVR